MDANRTLVLASSMAAVAALTLTACGGGHTGAKAAAPTDVAATGTAPVYPTDSAAPTDSPTDSPAPSASPTRTWKGTLALAAVNNPKLGQIVVDGKGFTLYRFDKDTAKPAVSNCAKACAKLWPPVKFTKHMKLVGVDPKLIGNIETKDGICQATLNGWPIYRYAKDTAPGDTNGQGVGGIWFAIAPNGKKAGGAAAPAPPANPGGYSNSGY